MLMIDKICELSDWMIYIKRIDFVLWFLVVVF